MPQLDLRLLSYFVAVAEELHFGRAAARLHIAQPSLSVQIRKLEHTLGTPLLVRSSRHVELTAAGEVLLDGSRKLLIDAERIAGITKMVGSGVPHRRLVVGFQANAAAELTPQILNAFHDVHPDVEVEMRSHDFTDPYVGLGDGSVDVAFVRPPVLVQDWLGLEMLFVESRLLVVSSSSPLAGESEIGVEQVLDQPFVARRAPEYWRNFWLATDARNGEPVRLGAEVTTVDECFEAILSERGVAFSQASTQRYYGRPGLSFIPVTDIPPTVLAIAWRTDVDSSVARDFVDTAKAVASLTSIPDAWAPPRVGAVGQSTRGIAPVTPIFRAM
ncbi:MAG: LysR family transcriptional regulator [Mycobacterium sp.]|nr:LysR family transcriptional regulator [Mycobacterium sp.]